MAETLQKRLVPACLGVCAFTLRADQHQRQVSRVPVAGEAVEVMINSLEAVFVLQTEHEDHGVNPQSKLQQREVVIVPPLFCKNTDKSCRDLVNSEIWDVFIPKTESQQENTLSLMWTGRKTIPVRWTGELFMNSLPSRLTLNSMWPLHRMERVKQKSDPFVWNQYGRMRHADEL